TGDAEQEVPGGVGEMRHLTIRRKTDRVGDRDLGIKAAHFSLEEPVDGAGLVLGVLAHGAEPQRARGVDTRVVGAHVGTVRLDLDQRGKPPTRCLPEHKALFGDEELALIVDDGHGACHDGQGVHTRLAHRKRLFQKFFLENVEPEERAGSRIVNRSLAQPTCYVGKNGDGALAHRTPPSTISVWAVIMRAASEARNRQGPTMSDGAISTFRHWRSRCAFSPSSVTQSARWRSVRTQPGAMALTRMPYGPSAPASPLVRPTTAALAAL